MKKRLSMLMLGSVLVSFTCIAQDSARALSKNAVYLELGGNGVFYSINYERIIFSQGKAHLSARVGYEFLPRSVFKAITSLSSNVLLAEVDVFCGRENSFFETGLGIIYDTEELIKYTYSLEESSSAKKYHNTGYFYRIGYRYHAPSGFIFRAAATPFIVFEPRYEHGQWKRNGEIYFYPLAGFTFGYSF